MPRLKIITILCLVAIPPLLAAFCPPTPRVQTRADEFSEQVVVLRAKQDMLQGTLLARPSEYFEETKVTPSDAPADYVQTLEKLKNQVLDRTMRKGEFLTRGCLSSQWSQYCLPCLRTGQVLCTISGLWDANGFVQPFDRVDVTVARWTNDGKKDSRLIVSRALILSASTDESVIGRAKRWYAELILVVTPEQAEELQEGMRVGELQILFSRPQTLEEAIKEGDHHPNDRRGESDQ
jgi:Flp pilus assembly protein CpaB